MKEITTISERISQMIDFLDITINEFAKKLKYSRSQAVYDIVSGKSKPSFDFFSKLYNSEFSEIFNYEWIIGGQKEMLKGKDVKLSIVSEPNESYGKRIPIYDGVVVAGQKSLADLSPQTQPIGYIDAGDWFDDATGAMQVFDDSMNEYPSGSYVAFRQVHDKTLIIPGQNYMIETSEYRVVKKIQKSESNEYLTLASTNTEKWEHGSLTGRLIHEPFDVHVDAISKIFKILGSVKRDESKFYFKH